MKKLLAILFLCMPLMVQAEATKTKTTTTKKTHRTVETEGEVADVAPTTRVYEKLIKHEVILSNSAHLPFGTSSTLSLNQGTSFWFSGGYNYTVPSMEMLQVGGSMYVFTGGGAGTIFQIAVGPTLNLPFDTDLRNAFFVDGYVGVTTVSATFGTTAPNVSNTSFTFGFDIGKRFKLFENLTYRPSFGIVKTSESVLFNFSFIAFSAVF